MLDFSILLCPTVDPDRRARMSDLARINGPDPNTIICRIARVEKRGWVTRGQVEEDRCGVFAWLTSAGEKKVESAKPADVSAVRDLLLGTFPA